MVVCLCFNNQFDINLFQKKKKKTNNVFTICLFIFSKPKKTDHSFIILDNIVSCGQDGSGEIMISLKNINWFSKNSKKNRLFLKKKINLCCTVNISISSGERVEKLTTTAPISKVKKKKSWQIYIEKRKKKINKKKQLIKIFAKNNK